MLATWSSRASRVRRLSLAALERLEVQTLPVLQFLLAWENRKQRQVVTPANMRITVVVILFRLCLIVDVAYEEKSRCMNCVHNMYILGLRSFKNNKDNNCLVFPC